nr:hypothetical protein [Tanacetum cinerariifolium]
MQQMHISQASGFGIDKGTGSIPGVPDAPTDESEEELSWNFTDEDGADNEGKDGDDDEEYKGNDSKEGDGDDDDEDDDGEKSDNDDADQEVERDDDKDDEEKGGDDDQEFNEEDYAEKTRDEESFDPTLRTPENSDDEGNGDEDLGLNIGGEEGHVEEEEEDELYRDQHSSSVSSQFVTSMLNLTLDVDCVTWNRSRSRTMDITIERQAAMDEALFPYAQRDMLHICPRVHGQSFDEPPFEEEILTFIHFLGHSATIKTLTDVNINKLYQPWRSFAAIINKCLTRKSSGYNSLRLSQAHILRTRSSSDTYITPPTAAASPRLAASTKGKQIAKASKAKSLSALSKVAMTEVQQLKLVTKRSMQQTHISQASGFGADEGIGSIPGVLDAPSDESEEELSWNSTDDEGADNEGKDGDDDEEDKGDDGKEGDGDDDDEDDDENGGDDGQEFNEEDYAEETKDEESFDPTPRTPENSDDKGNGDEDLGLNIGGEEGHVEEEEEDELYKDVNINQGRGIQATLEVEDSHVTLTPVNSDGMDAIFETTSQIEAHTSTSVALLLMSAPTITHSTISTITTTSQSPILSTTALSSLIQDLPNFGSLFGFDNRLRILEANFFEFRQTNQFAGASDRLHDEAQKENDEFLKTIDENKQKIIKEQVKEQVKTSYAVAADISEMELKKILIEKMEGNMSIQRFNEQRNLYKALVEAYESDKIILDTYRETDTLKKRYDGDADKDEEPSAGPDRGSKRRREGKEPESASALIETATRSAGSIQPWISELTKQIDSRSSFNELMDTPLDFSNFLINRLKVDTLTPELLAGPTYELMKGPRKSLVELEYHLEEVFKATTDQPDWVNPKGQQYPHNLLKPLPLIPNNRGHRAIPFEHFINNDLEYLRGGASSRYDKHALWGVSHWGRKRQQFYGFAINWESARDVYSKRRIIAVTELKIIEWHNYKHLDWITVRRNDDKLYKFKEGDFKRLRIQDIEDMLLLLRHVEDLQLGVESYQKKLNLTKTDTYRSDLKHKEAYIAYSNPRGFIYQNKDKRNRLMRIDELHKFSDGTLTDIRTALDDCLKGIWMQYLPQSIWRKSDKDRAAAMIQAIDKMLKTRRIMRSLKRFVGGRLYEGDFRMLQRTI